MSELSEFLALDWKNMVRFDANVLKTGQIDFFVYIKSLLSILVTRLISSLYITISFEKKDERMSTFPLALDMMSISDGPVWMQINNNKQLLLFLTDRRHHSPPLNYQYIILVIYITLFLNMLTICC